MICTLYQHRGGINKHSLSLSLGWNRKPKELELLFGLITVMHFGKFLASCMPQCLLEKHSSLIDIISKLYCSVDSNLSSHNTEKKNCSRMEARSWERQSEVPMGTLDFQRGHLV